MCTTENLDPLKTNYDHASFEYAERSAKELVLRHYLDDVARHEKRAFLEGRVGIPSSWFEEAAAMRAGYYGSVVEHVMHLVASQNYDAAAEATAGLIIPHAWISGGQSIKCMHAFLQMLQKLGTDEGEWQLYGSEMKKHVPKSPI